MRGEAPYANTQFHDDLTAASYVGLVKHPHRRYEKVRMIGIIKTTR